MESSKYLDILNAFQKAIPAANQSLAYTSKCRELDTRINAPKEVGPGDVKDGSIIGDAAGKVGGWVSGNIVKFVCIMILIGEAAGEVGGWVRVEIG
jgi:hypothetical protein